MVSFFKHSIGILLEYRYIILLEYRYMYNINICFSQSYFCALPMNKLGRMWSMMVGQKWD